MGENKIKAAIIFSIGLVTSTIIFSLAFYYGRLKTVAHISVKGLAEREVNANIGIWPIRFEASGNDLNEVNAQIQKQTESLVNFLKEQGFEEKEMIYGCTYLNDRRKYNREDKSIRYSVEMEIKVHSPKVFLLYETVQKSQEIIKRGVFLVGSRWDRDLKFIFTGLNKIKPSMIQEATINAKKAAEQFTIDANVHLGILRKASQGAFSIEDTHIATKKKIRVVTQMEYTVQ